MSDTTTPSNTTSNTVVPVVEGISQPLPSCTATVAAATTTTTTRYLPEQQLPQLRRYIYNDIDLQHFVNSSSKDALLKFTIAMGKSCAATTTTTTVVTRNSQQPSSSVIHDTAAAAVSSYEYNPQQPLYGTCPGIACLHGALLVMMNEWVYVDFPPTVTNQIGNRYGNPIFRQWYEQLQQRSIHIISTVLKISNQFSYNATSTNTNPMNDKATTGTDSPNEDDEYDIEILQQAQEEGMNAARTTVIDDNTNDHKFSEHDRTIIGELAQYFVDSFGHPIRLDYGTGHETSFHIVLFLFCRLRIFHNCGYQYNHDNTNTSNGANTDDNITTESSASASNIPPKQEHLLPSVQRCKAIILSMYHQYLRVTRTLQTQYMLEPAGSHGVWGLDDYYCLSFYFGACQFIAIEKQQQHSSDETFLPSSIHNAHTIQQYSATYLYYSCIQYIKSIKKNIPLYECSPMLNDISHIATWNKIAQGLIKLYTGEVLSKRPVVQHLVFGILFPAQWIPSQIDDTIVAPTETFRTMATNTTTAASTTTTAASAGGTSTNMPPPTRAPWAK